MEELDHVVTVEQVVERARLLELLICWEGVVRHGRFCWEGMVLVDHHFEEVGQIAVEIDQIVVKVDQIVVEVDQTVVEVDQTVVEAAQIVVEAAPTVVENLRKPLAVFGLLAAALGMEMDY